ncbi:death domain-associated protein 6 [Phlebotomus argentipes]|uniref:death domain-associated protein 6 n=1 Tax=Phlebotomus argentipes TaxID=94469 RepID=UPI0028929D04|nr:death domain-associated protein 6 [Phlebotomus argentipes]
MDSIIVLDSSDDEMEPKPPMPKKQKLTATILPTPVKPICSVSPKIIIQTITSSADSRPRVKEIRRITPIKIAERTPDKEKIRHFGDDEEFSPISSPISRDDREKSDPSASTAAHAKLDASEDEDADEVLPINPTYQELLDICRESENTPDMEMLIDKKLIRYYRDVHPDFVNSKSFCKTVRSVIEDIKANPGLVYLKISSILEELNTRRKSRDIVMVSDEPTSSVSEKRHGQIKRLSKALYYLKKRIARLEETEVDFNDDSHSAHIQAELYKKRACQIYEKICDLTGESKTAQRAVRKPIRFQETDYPEFNRALQMFVNRTNVFPDSMDVYKCLDHCNKQFGFGLRKDELKKIAQDAFVKIGKLLQCRRKADLYETVMHFTGSEKDPALVDKELEAKLQENKKHYSKINELIDSFAKRQESEAKVKQGDPETSSSAVLPSIDEEGVKDASSGGKSSPNGFNLAENETVRSAVEDPDECIIVLDSSDYPKND